jgi:hypothetical protein
MQQLLVYSLLIFLLSVRGKGGGGEISRAYGLEDITMANIHISTHPMHAEAESRECMGPYAVVDYNLHVDNACTMGNPLPESTLTLYQSRLKPPVRDFGFDICTATDETTAHAPCNLNQTKHVQMSQLPF